MVGMHFFNPADRMKLIEVIAGVNTPAETVEAIKKISVEIDPTSFVFVSDVHSVIGKGYTLSR